MFIWGSSTKLIRGAHINQVCSHCHTYNLYTYGLKRVFSLFWIPCFPYKSSYMVKCDHCETQYPIEQIQLPHAPAKIKTPLKYFSGLGVIASLLCFGLFNEHQENKQTQAYLDQPSVGDRYVVKTEDKTAPYTSIKVISVSNEEISFIPYNYSYSKISDARKAAKNPKDENYSNEALVVPTKDLTSLNIKQIIR